MAMVHLVNPHHFVCASSMVSRRLAEAFAKNSKPKGFEDTVPMLLHAYADVFSEMVIIYTQHKPRNAPKAGIMQR
jgi:hypothetical protein